MIIYLLLGIPMLMIDEIFIFLGQDKRVAFYAATYVKIVYPSIIFLYIFQACGFYCTSIQRLDIPPVATLIGTIIQFILTQIYCLNWKWGMEGICWAIFWNFTSRCAISCIMLKISSHPDVNPKVKFCSRETVRNLGPLFYLCISSCFMTVWLAWAFDILTLFSTYLSPE